MKILLVEDDRETSKLLAATLSAHRYAVDTIDDGEAGLDVAARWQYDLILLDVLLPSLNGIEVCRRLRAQDCQTPILMLTMKDSNEDVIAGLDAGADDYVAKSCDPAQLLARVRALLRRSGQSSPSPVLTWGLLSLDPASAQVAYNKTEITLRPKEYALLELFLRHSKRIFSRSAIIDRLWSMDEAPVEGSVTNLIKDLRQRLKSVGMKDDLIETVYGLGYRLKPAPLIRDRADSDRSDPSRAEWEARQQRGKESVQQIKDRFQASLEQRIATLEATEQSFQLGNINSQQCQEAQHEAHKLAGGLGTFGCAKASAIAQEIEHLLHRQVSPETCYANQFSQLLQKLKQELALRN